MLEVVGQMDVRWLSGVIRPEGWLGWYVVADYAVELSDQEVFALILHSCDARDRDENWVLLQLPGGDTWLKEIRSDQ